MNKYFIAGFIAGEGSFGFYKIKIKPNSYSIYFTIELHIRDLDILKKIKSELRCGNITNNYKRPKIVRFQVGGKKDIRNKVIPFMDKYLIDSYKLIQYKAWREKVINRLKYLST